jgi:hypothetical protein
MPNLREAQLRHATYFGKAVVESNKLYQKGGEDQLAGLVMFDREQQDIEVGWQWAAKNAGSVEADSLLLDYGIAGILVIGSRYEPKSLIKKHQITLSAARRLGRPRDEATTLANLGNVYIGIGEARKALPYFQQAK